MCRERDQVRRSAFSRALLEIPFCCLMSVDETHKDGADLRRRRGRWLRGLRNDCLSRDKKGMLRTSTMMAVGYDDGVLHSVTMRSPPAQNADDWLIFLSGLVPVMNKFVPGLPGSQQPDRCVLLYDNVPIHTAEADDFILINNVFPLRLPPYSPEFQPIEEVFSEYSHLLKSDHHLFPTEPEALWHALAVFSLREANIASHFEHSLLEAVRNVPELAGAGGLSQNAFEPLPSLRE